MVELGGDLLGAGVVVFRQHNPGTFQELRALSPAFPDEAHGRILDSEQPGRGQGAFVGRPHQRQCLQREAPVEQQQSSVGHSVGVRSKPEEGDELGVRPITAEPERHRGGIPAGDQLPAGPEFDMSSPRSGWLAKRPCRSGLPGGTTDPTSDFRHDRRQRGGSSVWREEANVIAPGDGCLSGYSGD